jgi:hypothetical protein
LLFSACTDIIQEVLRSVCNMFVSQNVFHDPYTHKTLIRNREFEVERNDKHLQSQVFRRQRSGELQFEVRQKLTRHYLN